MAAAQGEGNPLPEREEEEPMDCAEAGSLIVSDNETNAMPVELLQRQLALNTTLFQNGCTSHTFVIAYFQLQMDDLHPH